MRDTPYPGDTKMSIIEAYIHFISQPVVYVTIGAVCYNIAILMMWRFWVYERNINK